MRGTHVELQFAYYVSIWKNRLTALHLFRTPQDPKTIRSSLFFILEFHMTVPPTRSNLPINKSLAKRHNIQNKECKLTKLQSESSFNSSGGKSASLWILLKKKTKQATAHQIRAIYCYWWFSKVLIPLQGNLTGD